jgi:signal transduction histidine kinase
VKKDYAHCIAHSFSVFKWLSLNTHVARVGGPVAKNVSSLTFSASCSRIAYFTVRNLFSHTYAVTIDVEMRELVTICRLFQKGQFCIFFLPLLRLLQMQRCVIKSHGGLGITAVGGRKRKRKRKRERERERERKKERERERDRERERERERER